MTQAIDINGPIYRCQALVAAMAHFDERREAAACDASGHAVTCLEMLSEEIGRLAELAEALEREEMRARSNGRREEKKRPTSE